MEGDAKAAKSEHVAGRVADSTLLDVVVARLRDIERRTGIERTLAIGELVLTEFFGGNASAWRDRRRNKNNSIRRLAERSDCPVCRSALNEAVGVYVAVRGLPCVRTFGHISASHIASVLTLELEDRERMLGDAERERWSVRELRLQVTRLRRADGERRGRPCSSPELRTLSVVKNGIRLVDQSLTQLGELAAVGAESLVELRQLAAQLSHLGTRLLELAAEHQGPNLAQSGAPGLACQRSA